MWLLRSEHMEGLAVDEARRHARVLDGRGDGDCAERHEAVVVTVACGAICLCSGLAGLPVLRQVERRGIPARRRVRRSLACRARRERAITELGPGAGLKHRFECSVGSSPLVV